MSRFDSRIRFTEEFGVTNDELSETFKFYHDAFDIK